MDSGPSYSSSSSPLDTGGVKFTSSESREFFVFFRTDAFFDGVADPARFEPRDLTPVGGGVVRRKFVSTTFQVSTSIFSEQKIVIVAKLTRIIIEFSNLYLRLRGTRSCTSRVRKLCSTLLCSNRLVFGFATVSSGYPTIVGEAHWSWFQRLGDLIFPLKPSDPEAFAASLFSFPVSLRFPTRWSRFRPRSSLIRERVRILVRGL